MTDELTTPIDELPERVPFERARALLGLPRWKMRLAAGAGILPRDARGRFARADLQAALADPAGFARRVRDEEQLVATQAAEHLGVGRTLFNAAVADGVFAPVASRPWTYGTARLYRRGDLDARADAFAAWRLARRAQPRRHDPAAYTARVASRARGMAQRQAAEMALAALRSTIAQAPVAPLDERPIVALALWVHELDRWSDYLVRRKNRAPRARQRDTAQAALADVVAPTQALVGLTLARAALALPTVRAWIGGLTAIALCAACPKPAEQYGWDMEINGSTIYQEGGCANCRAATTQLRLEIEVTASSGVLLASRSHSLAEVLGWPHPGDRTPTLTPAPALVSWAERWQPETQAPPFTRPLTIDRDTWDAMTPDQALAAYNDYFGSVAERYRAGDVPRVELPAWLAAYGHGARSAFPGHRPLPSYWERRLMPLEMVRDELLDACASLEPVLAAAESRRS